MSAKRITIGRTFSSAPVTPDTGDKFTRTFTLPSGKQALFTLESITADNVESRTYVQQEVNGRDQSALTPESLRDITRTFTLQQFFPAIGVKRGERIEILDGSRRRAAAILCRRGLEVLVTTSAISAADARQFARDIQTAREHNLRETGMQLQLLKDSGMSQKEIAQMQGISQARVTRALQAAAVPSEMIAFFPEPSELSYPDYRTLMLVAEQAAAHGIELSTLVERIWTALEAIPSLHMMAPDEAKNRIVMLIRQTADSLLAAPAKEKTTTESLWQFTDKDRFARKRVKGRQFAYEFNRLPQALQDELDTLIAQALSRHLQS